MDNFMVAIAYLSWNGSVRILPDGETAEAKRPLDGPIAGKGLRPKAGRKASQAQVLDFDGACGSGACPDPQARETA
jgi:hypothetical protein